MSKSFQTWVELNAVITEIGDVDTLKEMLEDELERDHPRQQFCLRIHSRMNRLRAAEERLRLLARIGEKNKS